MLFNIIMYFDRGSCFHASLPGYFCLLASGQLPYEETCFHNLFLIDNSESPVTVEAIRHFRLEVNNQSIRFVFKDYNMSISDTFKVLTGKQDFLSFLEQKHSTTKIERANKAISSILSNL